MLTQSKPPVENSTLTEKPLAGVALVVDDEKNVLRICKKMTELCGLTVITAVDGIDAVTKFREHADEINIVLMDLTMPNMDGIAAMIEIYRIRPDVRLILTSGFNEDELSSRITGQNPSGFIRKPYSLNVLETELRRVMIAE
jgi:CheY-like chemotaxis protein